MIDPAGGDPIRILLCDDHKVLADALALMIRSDPQLRLVADPVDTAEEAVSLASEHKPDVVLMDVQLKGHSTGIEATRRIKQICPSTNVLVMSGSGPADTLLVEAVEAGASGFMPKTEAAEDVIASVKAAARGEILVDPQLLARVLQRVGAERQARRDAERIIRRLTEREREILGLLGKGFSNDDIAGKLYISPQTVQTHVRNILNKLAVHSKLEAVALGARAGALTV